MIGSGIYPLPLPDWWRRQVEKREALCEITKKNLMLMKMLRSALFFSFFLSSSRLLHQLV